MAEQRDGAIRYDQKDTKFGGGGETAETAEDVKKVKGSTGGAADHGGGYVGEIWIRPICRSRARRGAKRVGSAVRRAYQHAPSGYYGYDSWESSDTKENLEILNFGRDANRLDYFRVTPFDVHGGNDLRGVANYGCGRGGGNSSNNGSGGGDDDRSGRGEMVGTRS